MVQSDEIIHENMEIIAFYTPMVNKICEAPKNRTSMKS